MQAHFKISVVASVSRKQTQVYNLCQTEKILFFYYIFRLFFLKYQMMFLNPLVLKNQATINQKKKKKLANTTCKYQQGDKKLIIFMP